MRTALWHLQNNGIPRWRIIRSLCLCTLFANDANHRYKKDCAGKGCINEGIHLLKIRFINKAGWFCGYCKDSLLNDNLVDQVIHNTD